MRRIINFLKGFAKTADKIQERNKELQKRINDITNELKVKSPYITVSPNVNPNLENFIKKYTIVWEKAVIVFCDFNSSQKHICKFVNVYKIIDFILKNISYPLTCPTQLGTI